MTSACFLSVVQLGAFWRSFAEDLRSGDIVVSHAYGIEAAEYRAMRLNWPLVWVRVYVLLFGCARLCWRLMTTEHSVYVVTTSPFFLPAFVAFVLRRPVVIWFLDIYPEALEGSGAIRRGGFVSQLVRMMNRYAILRARRSVALGDRLKASLIDSYGQLDVDVIPVGSPHVSCVSKSDCGTPRIVYSGNMGALHDFDTIIGAWRSEQVENLICFCGSGPGYGKLRRALGNMRNVTFLPSLDGAAWEELMAEYQVALVTIKRGAGKVLFPSKAFSSLAFGHAILAVCEKDCDLGRLVEYSGAGWVVEPGDVDGLVAAIRECNDLEKLAAKRHAGRNWLESHCGSAEIARRWRSTVEAALAQRCSEAKPTV